MLGGSGGASPTLSEFRRGLRDARTAGRGRLGAVRAHYASAAIDPVDFGIGTPPVARGLWAARDAADERRGTDLECSESRGPAHQARAASAIRVWSRVP